MRKTYKDDGGKSALEHLNRDKEKLTLLLTSEAFQSYEILYKNKSPMTLPR